MSLITYVLPTVRKRFLSEAINSVLHQTLTDLELFVLDGARVLSEGHPDPRVKRIDTSNMTVAQGFNLAISQASSDIILNICDDDVDKPHRAQYLYDKMQETGADVFLASYDVVNEQGDFVRFENVYPWNIKKYILGGLNMPLWSGAYRKSTCPKWREDFWLLGDYAFFLDCQVRGLTILTSGERVANIRHWPGQLCASSQYLDMLRRLENQRICKIYNLDRLNR